MVSNERANAPCTDIKEAGTDMPSEKSNKYRAAIEILHRGRDVLVAEMADEILDRQEDLSEGGFLLNEFLESQGTRLHFMSLMVGHLEQSAEAIEETRPLAPPTPAPKPKPAAQRRPRAKKLAESTSGKGSAEEH